MVDHKPLPAIPTSASLTTLSVDARQHRGRLIRHFLSEVHEFGINSRREGWAYVIEEALDELGQYLGKGDGLEGIRKSKEAQRNTRKRERDAERELQVQETVKSKKLPKAPSNETPKHSSDGKVLTEGASHTSKDLPPHPLSTTASGKLLLLSVAPLGSRTPVPTEDSGFDVVPANIGCTFIPGTYTFQDTDLPTVLFGRGEWINTSSVQLIGGTFTFRGVNSQQQHQCLFTILRLSIYIQFSMVLEQHLLSDSNIPLTFPRPKLPSPSPSVPSRPSIERAETKYRKRISFLPHGIFSFFSSKTNTASDAMRHRSSTIMPVIGRGGSLDLGISPFRHSRRGEGSPRSSFDSSEGAISRLRRLSTIDRRSSTQKSAQAVEDSRNPFTHTLAQIQESSAFLSTSPGVIFPAPTPILDLAQSEKLVEAKGDNSQRRLRGDERAGLASVLGWEGRENMGNGMKGIPGFVKHQGISVLRSQHIPSETTSSTISTSPPAVASELEAAALAGGSLLPVAGPSSVPACKPYMVCGRAEWKTYKYYSSDPEEDVMLGGAVDEMVLEAAKPCAQAGCRFKKGEHEVRLIHGGVRIAVDIVSDERSEKEKEKEKEDDERDGDRIDVWESCLVCGAKSKRNPISDGTRLLSLGKFLELLVYSPLLGSALRPPLCEHTAPAPTHADIASSAPSSPSTTAPSSFAAFPPPLSSSRLNILRHFTTKGHTVTFTCSAIEDIFELRVPRLQITRGTGGGRCSRDSSTYDVDGEEEKRVLRREIKRWWEGVADHMDKLEMALARAGDGEGDPEATPKLIKALPRLPSTDEAYDDMEPPRTPPRSPSRPLEPLNGLPSAPSTPTPSTPVKNSESPSTNLLLRTPSGAPAPPPTPVLASTTQNASQPAVRLSSLRHTFHHTEQSLYAQLARTPASSLNDARRSFIAAAKGAEKRLRAWQRKHLSNASEATTSTGRSEKENDVVLPETMELEEPEWWGKKCHAVPGSNVIVREDDWGSIISFTLSTADYHRELSSMSIARLASTASQASTPAATALPQPPAMDASPSLSHNSNQSSFFSSAMGYRLFTSSTSAQPDPDADDVTWSEPEPFSSVISRKEHPRDPSSLLSIREVLRQKSSKMPVDGASAASTSGAAAASSQRSNGSVTPVPPSAWAKPDVGISMDEAGGKIEGVEEIDGAGRILQELESIVTVSEASRPPSRTSSRVNLNINVATTAGTGLGLGEVHMHAPTEKEAPSIISMNSDAETETENTTPTLRKEVDAIGSTLRLVMPPPVPPKDPNRQREETAQTSKSREVSDSYSQGPTSTTTSSFASTLTTGISNAMRYMLNTNEPSRPSSPVPKPHHGLLSATGADIDERPHIKYDWTIGKRLKFSCTVYFAKQFDVLRRRCGIDDVFVKSLSRSTNWAAEGGKSRSYFWKTKDERFIIKTLVDAWNVADLQVLIELAPSYFRYVDATASKATILAKMIGFYTIEIRNLETGAVQSKADLLVMENLFYDQKVAKTFDLKGIQGRKVKPATGVKVSQNPKTLFDGEWIEGQQRALMLVRPHSKQVLRTAIRSDSEFLAKSNIMDYSLLVGVDEERKEIACGLVDTIGSYTFAKTLEYKAKHGLNSGKEITVIPPAEYQERFVSALEGYFLACPDKWSKPLDDSKITDDPNLLPSVL
ncbi:hypothetical protein Hypma_010794 [Hypsizygus marmoreus]|uniref:PIPK domain-containing protein n=1 Tax=Hypsizygus marmoreus TaxID=39966 RepID=A0A369JKG8_HYPMA|nr:hypothetical protein Hypma_010794 [Hypsizygus marmoreus]